MITRQRDGFLPGARVRLEQWYPGADFLLVLCWWDEIGTYYIVVRNIPKDGEDAKTYYARIFQIGETWEISVDLEE